MAASIHIGGLSSGNDYASMIAQLMEARQVPITTKQTALEELDYDMGAWSEVQSMTSELTDALDGLRSYEMWRDMSAVSSDESIITATADTGSLEQNYTINVTNTAVAQSISSDEVISTTDLITDGFATEGDIFEIEGEQITIEAGETLSSLRTKINTAALSMTEDQRVQASIVNNYLVVSREKTGAEDVSLSNVSGTTLTDLGFLTTPSIKNEWVAGDVGVAQRIASDEVVSTTDLVSDGFVTQGDIFQIEGQQITIEAGETLTNLASKINTAALSMAAAVRVQATVVDNQLILTREQTGATDINLSDVSGNALIDLGVLTDIKNERVAGENAQFTVNGISIERTENAQLSDVIEGLTIEVQGEGTAVLEVRPDRVAAKTAITDFVDKYNALAEVLDDYGLIVMGDSSNLAQKGELYGDSLLNSLESSLRRLVTDVKSPSLNETNASYSYKGNDGIMDSLGDLGIWTSGEMNRLEVNDEEKLDYLLEHEFDKVEQLFKGTYNETEVAYENGVASDLYKYSNRMSEALTGDIALRIDALTENYDELSDTIDEMTAALPEYEQAQWDIFTGMEDALANMKSQQSYLSSVFSSS